MIKMRLDELIQERGLKKKYISKRINVSDDTLTNWMNNKSYPRLDKSVQLADLLQCDVNDLYIKK